MTNPYRWAATTPGNVDKPPEAKKDKGWNALEPAAAQYMNWWMGRLGGSVERLALSFLAIENIVPNMAIIVLKGFIPSGSGLPIEVAEAISGIITAPVSDPRIDRVGVNKVTGAIEIITGVENAVPVPPSYPEDVWPVCQILLDNSPVTISITDSLITDERIFLPAPADAIFDAGSSGTAITINWVNGSRQKVMLTDHVTITLIGGVDGTDYELFIHQDSIIRYGVKMNHDSQVHWQNEGDGIPLMPVEGGVVRLRLHRSTAIIPARSQFGLGIDMPDHTHFNGTIGSPLQIDTFDKVQHVAFSPDGRFVAFNVGDFTSGVTDWLFIFRWLGSRMGDLVYMEQTGALAGGTLGLKWSPSGRYLARLIDTTPFIEVFPWNNGMVGPAFPDPSIAATASVLHLDWSPDETAIAISTLATPFVEAWKWSDAGWGTKYSNPASLPGGAGDKAVWSPLGDYIAIPHAGTPFIAVYPWTFAGGFGTKVANPSPLPANAGKGVAWSPDGLFIVMGISTTPFVEAYNWSAGFGSEITAPVGFPTFTFGTRDLEFSPDGTFIYITAANNAAEDACYPWSAGFGTILTSPAHRNPNAGEGLQWSPDGNVTISVGDDASSQPWQANIAPRAAINWLGSIL